MRKLDAAKNELIKACAFGLAAGERKPAVLLASLRTANRALMSQLLAVDAVDEYQEQVMILSVRSAHVPRFLSSLPVPTS